MEKVCSIYIHVPFCKSKCYYCDFNSYANCDEYISEYFKCLKKEIQMAKLRLRGYTIKTIFIGGGTPTYVAASHIYEILELMYCNFNISKDAEITIEANPGTINGQKMAIYRDAKINRISMGLQSTNDEILGKIGRIHTYKEFVDNFNLAREMGFSNISVDLIFGIPFQSYDNWKRTLYDIVKINPEHISAYSLTIEPNTVFGKLHKQGKLAYVDDELDRQMYHYAIDYLGENSYSQYEISNFAKPNKCSRHNKVYWELGYYIGFGAGAHSYFEEIRYNNVCDIANYIKCINYGQDVVQNVEEISKQRKISDYMILGLRLMDGINKEKFYRLFAKDIDSLFGEKFEVLLKQGLITNSDIGVKLTNKGKDLANIVFMEFLD